MQEIHLDIINTIFTLITGGVSIYFLFQDRRRRVKIKLELNMVELPTKERTTSGFQVMKKIPCLRVDLINKKNLDVHLSTIELYLQGQKVKDEKFKQGTVVQPGTKTFWVYRTQFILDQCAPLPRKIHIQVKATDETGVKFQSRTFQIHSKDLVAFNLREDE